jgi:tetratricopeptide (TPR) repeat protein
LLLVLLSAASVSIVALLYSRRPAAPNDNNAQRTAPSVQHISSSAYADPSACSACHESIARTYSLTGMARSFTKLSAQSGRIADFTNQNRLKHSASDRSYTTFERDGRFYQRRHQTGFDGKEANVFELEAHYVIGSGNHARTFLHRAADGRLLQLPVSWYAEQGARQGYWAMSPGYDKPAHMDFRRVIDAGCMSCHNAYPRAPVEDDLEIPKFSGSIPEGIDCQRCHGPGQAHVDALKAGDVEAGIRAIVNPAKLDRERQLETCMQCHLETTSSPLPFQIRRYEHPPFSYAPGKPLSDYFIHFDHAEGTGREDKFEIASGAYRLRKSACFQQSQMTCGTCHDPHDIPRGEKAVQHYVSVCQSCHTEVHRGGAPRLSGAGATATCIDCHMPKRRAEDAVHVVMTDHYIQRQRPQRDLVAARTEADGSKHGDYRGEVVPYYPQALSPSAENELYLALAQVQQGSNVSSGIRRLEDAIDKHKPSRPEFYYELARAYSRMTNDDAAIRWSGEALRRDPNFVPALKQLATAATSKGSLPEAAEALERAVRLAPQDENGLADLGSLYLRQDRLDDAERVLRRALALNPALPLAANTMGLAALRRGTANEAEKHFREAIRLQPDLAEAHNNLGNLLASRREYPEAAHHFGKAVIANPDYVEARHSHGVVLGLLKNYPRAVAELEAVIRRAPQIAQARLDLADVLVAMGRLKEARAQLEAAAKSGDPAVRAAAQSGLLDLDRRQSP